MEKKALKENILKGVLFLGICLILATFYYQKADDRFQRDSEALAMGPILAEVLDVDVEAEKENYGLGGLISKDYPKDNPWQMMKKENTKGYEYRHYVSQVGFQGIVYAWAAGIIHRLGAYKLFRYGCCFLMAVIVILITIQLNKRYGMYLASIFFLSCALSQWIINFARNLYWVEFTWFIPMFLGLLCLNYESKRKYIYPLFGVALFIKCLCGYEYISTIMWAGIMFFIAEALTDKKKTKDYIKAIFIIGIFSVIGFLAAYIIHANIFGKGDIVEGLKQMQVYLVEKRTFGNAANFMDRYSESLNASILDVINKYFYSTDAGKVNLRWLLLGIAGLIYQRKFLKDKNNFDIALFFTTFIGPVSWIVLGKSHSYIHTHMNFVLFYMGWIQVSIYIVVKAIVTRFKIKVMIGDKVI